MMETSDFKKLLYRISYVIAAIIFTIGVALFGANNPNNQEVIGIGWMFLLSGAYFNFKYFIYRLKNNK